MTDDLKDTFGQNEASLAGAPFGYAYRFSDPISGKPVWVHGKTRWNGQEPTEAKALFGEDVVERLEAENERLRKLSTTYLLWVTEDMAAHPEELEKWKQRLAIVKEQSNG